MPNKKTRSKSDRRESNITARSRGSSLDMTNQYQKKQQEVTIVRNRFAHYQPQGISHMAITHDKSLLAISRSNNQIEIWKSETFAQLLIVPGNKNADIRRLHWVEPKAADEIEDANLFYYTRSKNSRLESKKRRLVSTGLNGMVIEWDL